MAHPIFHLQAALGNLTVQRLLRAGAIQTTLTIGQPGDRYEHEADRAAAHVLQMPEPTSTPRATEGRGHAAMQHQRSDDTEAISGRGQPLSRADREFFEPRFDRDFGQVRVHADAAAAELANSIDARAFTLGRNIVFGAGEYASGTRAGRALLAHELTHVVQQSGGGAQHHLQRVRIENGRKKFDCPDLAGDAKLEACLNDEDRLRPFDSGPSVARIQRGLQRDGADLGTDGTSGVYGAATGQAVMAFKKKHALGSTQFSDVGPGTTGKLDELCVGSPEPQPPAPPRPRPPRPERPGPCGPGTANPFCLPVPALDSPCTPFPSVAQAEAVRDNLRATIPPAMIAATRCGEVGPVWESYFAGSSTPFAFSSASSCVVAAAKTDPEGSDVANRAATAHLQDIRDNLPVTLRGVSPAFAPLGGPIAVRRLPLEDAIGPHGAFFLHPPIVYNNPFNAAANLAGGVGRRGGGSDLFGDDDRVIGGTVVIEVESIEPTSGMLTGQVRWQPHIHVKDTVDFCPGNLGNSVQRDFTIPMSKLEAMGLTRDVPITIDYDLEVQQSNFTVLPLIGPLPPTP